MRGSPPGTAPGTPPADAGLGTPPEGARFDRSRRLRKGAEFERVFQDARRSSDRYFTVLARAREEDAPDRASRLGLAVGKKRIRRAVARNRIKRLIRESFRHHAHLLPALDVVVLCRCDASPGNPILRRSLESHWRRIAKLGARGSCTPRPAGPAPGAIEG